MKDNLLLAGGSLESKPAWGNIPRCCPRWLFSFSQGHRELPTGVTPAWSVSSTGSGRRLALIPFARGSQGLTSCGRGTLVLSDANTHSGATTISAGTLQIGNAVTTGAPDIGNFTDNATLSFLTGDLDDFPSLANGAEYWKCVVTGRVATIPGPVSAGRASARTM
jgi:autotransporter-associated beta strand protein